MIDSIRFDDLEEALDKMRVISGPDYDIEEYALTCMAVFDALGGQREAPNIIRYLLDQETKRLSSPR